GGVLDAVEPELQAAIFEVRKAGLNIMMSMKQAGKPISFVEDCAVDLKDLADYTTELTEIFTRHGTQGTWYAHASVGCLHVRPVLNLKLDQDVKKMRAIAEEAFELVRKYKGSHSGEHGDGLVRSEFHEPMFGARMTATFKEVKSHFDPSGLLNPGKIVDPPKMDDRSLLRYPPDYAVKEFPTVLDWSAWPGAGGGFQGAVEMCNNNGACRKLRGDVMCPSFRVTRNERDLTRGRANVLRLALSGQLGPDALTGDAMAESLKLCVSCKACKRECPTGVDMARMKIEVAVARAAARGISLHERLIAYLPRYAPWAARLPWLMNLRDRLPGVAQLSQRLTGFTAQRKLPRWRRDFDRPPAQTGNRDGKEVILFGDTFNTYFEPENLKAARDVLTAAGYNVLAPRPSQGTRPLCCGRTFLTVGLADEARAEAQRLIDAYAPYAERGVAIVGLEPSCLFALRDELVGLFNDKRAATIAAQAVSFEEFLAEADVDIDFQPLHGTALLHGHCHQKAFAVMPSVEKTLRLVPGLNVEIVESSCCGMAGAFGYAAETYDISRRMAELSLLPAVRAADGDAIVVADGTSCREQILHGAEHDALHVARVLHRALPDSAGSNK
ncbi:MAG: 4Fe-4S dicluster domain-containing protein, partial [Gammaproteobacteria bacterium]|nr:4Fe-4S dicluster domain-containing protein [Gammaproteobacteria bacterium]